MGVISKVSVLEYVSHTCPKTHILHRGTLDLYSRPNPVLDNVQGFSLLHKLTPLFISAGFGGGYMEREQVEYVEKEVSDSEYDQVCVFYASFEPCLREGTEYYLIREGIAGTRPLLTAFHLYRAPFLPFFKLCIIMF